MPKNLSKDQYEKPKNRAKEAKLKQQLAVLDVLK
jgi:hypothetical protein